MNNLIINKVDEIRNQLTEQKSVNLRTEFEAILPSLQEYEIDYKSILAIDISQTTGELAIRARNLRLNISKVRKNIEKFRKKEKADILEAGRVIDSFGRIIKENSQTGEQQLKEYENYEENQQLLKLANLNRERLAELQTIHNNILSENNICIEDYTKRFGQLIQEPVGSLDDERYKVWKRGFLEIIKTNINTMIVDRQIAINKENELERLRKENQENDLKIAKAQEREKLLKEEADAKEKLLKEADAKLLQDALTKVKVLQKEVEAKTKLLQEAETKIKVLNGFIKIINNCVNAKDTPMFNDSVQNKIDNLLSDY